MDQEPDPNYKKWKQLFRSQNWNQVGATLLAVTSWFSEEHYIYVRPKLVQKDFVILFVTGAFGSLLPAFHGYGALVGLCLAGFYILWRISRWKPFHEVLQQDLNRKLQRILVSRLTDVCVKHAIEPEDGTTLMTELRHEDSPFYLVFRSTITDFVKLKLDFQE